MESEELKKHGMVDIERSCETQIEPYYAKGSQQPSGYLKSLGGEDESVQPSSIAFDFPLTVQQREAISRRHHLKFITGHYGSGKVEVYYAFLAHQSFDERGY